MRRGNATRLMMVCLSGAPAAPAANSAGAHVRLGEKDGEAQRLPAGMWRLLAPSRRSRSVRMCRNPLSIGAVRTDVPSASGESCRMSSGQSTLRFRDLLTAEVVQHLSFRPNGSSSPHSFSRSTYAMKRPIPQPDDADDLDGLAAAPLATSFSGTLSLGKTGLSC
jgi:hypothetical protein